MSTEPVPVEIPQDIPGFTGFMGSWVFPGEVTVIVDCGPASTAGRLLASLEKLGLKSVDYILLSHVHIDHAGGLSALLERYPQAKAICHAKGLEFLVDPSKLWVASLKVLGEVGRTYGPPPPVAAERLIPHTSVEVPGMTVIETPGHAVHHLSYSWRGRLFSGEAGGNLIRVNGHPYLRPATPPRFFLSEALGSVDRMLALPDQPIHYAHFSWETSSHEMLDRFRRQLLRWADIIKEQLDQAEQNDGRTLPAEELERRCVSALLASDPELTAYQYMDETAQGRERTFMTNSIRGFLGFLKSTGNLTNK